MFKRLGLFGVGTAIAFAGYQEVTAPTIELSDSDQTACSEEITTAVNACRANALGFNTSDDPESPLFQAREGLRQCLSDGKITPVMSCSAPDSLFPAHFYVGGYPRKN